MHRLISLVLSLYVAAFIYTNAFFIERLTIAQGSGQLFWNKLAIFLIILLPIHILINKFVVVYKSRGGGGPFRTILLAAVFICLSMAMLYHVIPLDSIYDLPTYIDKYFASETMFTVWLIVPLIALFI